MVAKACLPVLLVALAVLPAAAGSIQNGDFSQGLTGWNTTGPVSVQGGAALLEEDQQVWITSLSQQFTIPSGAQTLSFRYGLDSTPDTGGGEAFPDDFRASLLDPSTGDAIISTVGYDDYFYVDRLGFKDYGSRVNVSGDSVTLDLTSLSLPKDARIQFDEYGGLDGFTTTVWVDDVELWPEREDPPSVPEPVTLLALAVAGAGLGRYWRHRWAT